MSTTPVRRSRRSRSPAAHAPALPDGPRDPALPLPRERPDDIVLYTGDLLANSTSGNANVPWRGPRGFASLRADRRVALFAVPLFRG